MGETNVKQSPIYQNTPIKKPLCQKYKAAVQKLKYQATVLSGRFYTVTFPGLSVFKEKPTKGPC